MNETADPLVAVLVDIEKHVGGLGWDQPARLFALVPTADLLAAEPDIAASLGIAETSPGALTAIEQDEFHAGGDLVEDLERITWPDAVVGCALSVERAFVPPAAEAGIPDDPDAAAEYVNAHPEKQDLRVVAGVLRTGAAHAVARIESQPHELLSGADLVPGLERALARTLDPA